LVVPRQLTQSVPTLKVTLINYSKKRGAWGQFYLKKTYECAAIKFFMINDDDIKFVILFIKINGVVDDVHVELDVHLSVLGPEKHPAHSKSTMVQTA
jgi:hypothetical protein